MKNIIFNLEGTLVGTEKVEPYMKSRAGRLYAERNIDHIPTYPNEEPIEILKDYSKYLRAASVTSLPKSCAKKLVEKHNLPKSLVVANSGKSLKKSLEACLRSLKADPEDALFVTDRAAGVLAAHDVSVPSLGVLWGFDKPCQIFSSEPTAMAGRQGDLKHFLNDFEKGKLKYQERTLPRKFKKAKFRQKIFAIGFSLGDYVPTSDCEDSYSLEILNYKSCRDIIEEDIRKGAEVLYFDGNLKKRRALSVLSYFFGRLVIEIEKRGIGSNAAFIGAPNSLPEFCYRFDVNERIARAVAEYFGADYFESRPFAQIFPLERSYGDRRQYVKSHLETMGIKKEYIERIKEIEEFWIIDDTINTGSQVIALAILIGSINQRAKIRFATLGKQL